MLAKASTGSTGADIEMFARRARAIARRAGHSLSGEDLAIAMGQRLNGMDQATRRLVSVHEAGHVAVAKILGRDVQEVYLNSGGGITVFDPARYDLTKANLMDTICIMIAGRSAEEKQDQVCNSSGRDIRSGRSQTRAANSISVTAFWARFNITERGETCRSMSLML